nr:MAG TPA: hypothetical protein [Caudoviricetes sp.]
MSYNNIFFALFECFFYLFFPNFKNKCFNSSSSSFVKKSISSS